MRQVLLATLLPLVLAACGSQTRAAPPQPAAQAPAARTQPAPAPEPRPAPRVVAQQPGRCEPGYRSLISSTRTWAAVVRTRATAFRRPGRGAFADFGKVNANDYPTIFGVRGKLVGRDCSVRWYRVELPIRPNGAAGWVRARAVDLEPVRTRIVVDLSQRRVTLYRSGRRVLSTRAAIGAAATPTPTGRYYVNQRLIPEDEDGPFGPGAIGISAFSDVLTGWAQGGPVAIHGTNAPWLIGQAISNGCIRVANADLRRLFAQALAGTPVTIRT
jgi:lipoprotein-anchoring transpeptidase ErfK/SrfK